MMDVRRRCRVPLEFRKRLVEAFENPNEDYLVVADSLGLHRSTARGIVATYIREGRTEERPRGGRNNVKIDAEMKECLNSILEEKCLMTLSDINRELRRRLPRKSMVHDRTISRALDGMLIRVSRPVSGEENRPDMDQQRLEYVNWLMTEGVRSHCIFVGECAFSIWTARSYGSTGETAYRQVCGQRGRNVTIVMALSPINGLVHHLAQVGGITRQLFDDFLVQARQQLDPNKLVVFIYDNTPAYRNVTHPGGSTELKALPPYSPFLNIVEQAMNSLKNEIKADISRADQQERFNNRDEAKRQGIPLGEYRQKVLLEACQRNIDTVVTPQKCSEWFRFMQTSIPCCLKREDIEG